MCWFFKKDYGRDDELFYVMDHAIDFVIAAMMKQTPICISVARVHFYGARSPERTDFKLGVSSTVFFNNIQDWTHIAK